VTFENYRHIVFLGIGGIGMSSLARYFNSIGKYEVQGYDLTPSDLTRQLVSEGIGITFEDQIYSLRNLSELDKANTLVVYTPAIPEDLYLKKYFFSEGYTLIKRALALGIATEDTTNLSVAGTHGKTTTSCILAHLLRTSQTEHVAFLGGISTNIDSNYYNSIRDKSKAVSVSEADEYDRSFLQLKPKHAVITSMDADHLDIYGEAEELEKSFIEFANCVRSDGKVVLHYSLKHTIDPDIDFLTYGIDYGTYHGTNIRILQGAFHFDLVHSEFQIKNIRMGMPGIHNIENAIAAVSLYHLNGGDPKQIKKALATFQGVKRRFQYITKEPFVYIDDYAHHPEELQAIIESVRDLYPRMRITGVFQPHLYSRTRDFHKEFARSLDELDEVILLDIYPAREEPIEGISSQIILDKMRLKKRSIKSKAALIPYLKKNRPEVLLSLGAGDIDRLVQPIKEALS